MTSYFSKGFGEFDTLLDKTTSDLLPSGSAPDIAGALHLADLIRSSSVAPLKATAGFLRRLNHDNPNVQLLTLQVLDIAIKNGGTPFLLVIGGREPTNDLERLARAREGSSNRQVQELVLKLIQDWASAFSAKAGLRDTELVRAYESLRRDGMNFPPRDPLATAAMVDSLSAPEWLDSAYCTRCRSGFTFTNRKHHCRHCGNVFDSACSSQTAVLPHYGILEAVRVCDGCKKLLKEGKTTLGRRASSGAASANDGYRNGDRVERRATTGGSRYSNNSSARSKEDADLQRAIDASLADAGNSASATNGPAFALRTNPTTRSSAANRQVESEEDPDLAAAIAASLRDIAIAPSAPPEDDGRQRYNQYAPSTRSTYQPYPTTAPASSYAPLQSYDLTASETTSLSRFTSLLNSPPPMLGSREREIYEAAKSAHPRLERGLEDTERRKELLQEMEGKLGEVVRLYEGLLREKNDRGREFSSPYPQQSPSASYYTPSQQYASSSYPTLPQSQQTQPPQQYYTPQYPQQPQYQEPQSYGYAPQSPQNRPESYPQYAEPQPYQPDLSQQQQYSQAPPPQSYSTAPPQESYAPPLTSPPIETSYQAPHIAYPSYVADQPQQQQPQQHVQPQPVQQVPAGYYKPSSFPVVPTTALPVAFPSVPVDNPWEREQQQKEDQSKVGELIEF